LSGYLFFIDLVIYLFLGIMGRHLWKRSRFHLHMFQQSGYKIKAYARWMWSHWGSHVIPVKHGLYNLLILTLLLLTHYVLTITDTAATLILVIFALFWFIPADFYGGNRPKKPFVFTARMQRLTATFIPFCLVVPIAATYLAFTIQTLTANIYILAFGWIVADVLAPFWVFPAAWLMSPVEKRIHNKFKRMARQKIEHMDDLTVIALTGSYGKTTTKFLLRDLLKERFNVLATPGSYNTPMGICKVINNDLKPTHQMLILEMGARHKGNIKELCEIAPPDITIATIVGVAHLETFGSKEAIAATKQEIVENMKTGGFSVLNADNKYTAAMDVREDVTFIKAGIEQGDVLARDIEYGKEGCSFTITQLEETDIRINMPLLGGHNIYNMLFAATVARKVGVRPKTIELAAQKAQQVEHRLELKKQGDIHVIDDAFNSNPIGARNAVEILAQFKDGQRIIITPGMIELGDIEKEENYRFGETIGSAGLELVILVGESHTKPIREGIAQTAPPHTQVKVVESLFDANDLLKEYANPGDVVLYENDLPDTYNE